MAIVIGVDVGTSGTKAVAVNESGDVVASALIEYPLYTPKPGWAEQDPADWANASFEALSHLAAQVDANDVKGIGLTGQMHGSVFLDDANEVIRPALLWCDQRTAPQCDAITSKVGAEKLIDMVANPALTGFTAPKILWLRDEEPAHYDRVRKVLLPKDYIRYLLTGEFATDVADASGTLLLDIGKRTWHDELLSILEIDKDWLPKTYEGPEVTGTLSGEAAAKVGLPAGIPVVAGGGDQAAGAVGCGIVRTGAVSASLGTSGVVFAFADEVAKDPEGRVHTFCHSVPGACHVMGVVLSAGGSLRWYRDEICGIEKEVARITGNDPYEFIAASAARAPLGSEGLIFLPYLTGERTPHKDPDARGAFIGLSLRHTKAHMARAVLEGVTYAMRDSFEILRSMNVPISEVRASGGGARSPFWRRIQADIYNAPVATLNVEEGPAYGAALLAAVGAGEFGSVEEACDATIKTIETIEPMLDAAESYDRWFPHFQNAYRALAPTFRDVAGLVAEDA